MTNPLGITPNWQTLNSLKELSINKAELHLWWLPLTISAEQQDLAYSLLSEKQVDKLNRRSTPELKQIYLAGRYYLYTLLAAYQKCAPNEIQLDYGRLNKPYLSTKEQKESADSIEFNFTDTTVGEQPYALFAFCRNKEVGVDLESKSRAGDFTRIAKRRFTEKELYFAHTETNQLNQEKCLAIWTRKEAYGKALGVGINFTMNQRNLVGDVNHEYNFNDGQKDWRLLQIQPDEEFIACVVHETHQTLSIKAFNSLKSKP